MVNINYREINEEYIENSKLFSAIMLAIKANNHNEFIDLLKSPTEIIEFYIKNKYFFIKELENYIKNIDMVWITGRNSLKLLKDSEKFTLNEMIDIVESKDDKIFNFYEIKNIAFNNVSSIDLTMFSEINEEVLSDKIFIDKKLQRINKQLKKSNLKLFYNLSDTPIIDIKIIDESKPTIINKNTLKMVNEKIDALIQRLEIKSIPYNYFEDVIDNSNIENVYQAITSKQLVKEQFVEIFKKNGANNEKDFYDALNKFLNVLVSINFTNKEFKFLDITIDLNDEIIENIETKAKEDNIESNNGIFLYEYMINNEEFKKFLKNLLSSNEITRNQSIHMLNNSFATTNERSANKKNNNEIDNDDSFEIEGLK